MITSLRLDSVTKDMIYDLGKRGQSFDGILYDMALMIKEYQELGTVEEFKKLKGEVK